MPFISKCAPAALLTILMILPVAAMAQLPPATASPAINTPAPGAVVVNLRDVDIADVAQQVSRITRRTIILDPAVRGTVTVVSTKALDAQGVWQLFTAVLQGQGYAVVHNGRAWRIIPQANAAREPSTAAPNGRIVTRMIRLDRVEPEAALRVLKPLVASFGSIEMVANPKAIVVTDYADNVARIAELAHALDRNGGNGFDTIVLRYASAKDVATAIQGMIGDGDNAAPHAVADARSNSVLVRGDAGLIAEARRVAATLDHPGGAAPTTRVFRLRYNDAESVTAVLRGLMGEGGSANNPVARTLAGSSRNGGASNGVSGLGSVPFGGGSGSTGVTSLSSNPAMSGGGSGSSGSFGGGGMSGLGSAAAMNPPLVNGTAGPATGQGGFSTPELAVEPAPELNAIVVRGTPAAIRQIESLVTQLDVRRPQVMIEAAIVEINGDMSEQLGVQLGNGAAANGVTNTVGTSFSNLGLSLGQVLAAVGSPAAVGLLNNGLTADLGSSGNFRLLIQALGSSTRANLLSTPSITTLDNEPAEIVVGQNVPFRTGSFSTAGNTTTPFTTIERADVGITLRIVPRVHEGDTVRLDVSQEVSSLVGQIAGAADIITNRRSIQTTVLADDGQTIVLGGLISDDRTRIDSRVPVLGDIPVLGNLFKSRTEQKTRRTLFVFLRPTILRDPADITAAAAAKYARVKDAEKGLSGQPSLLLQPPGARLPIEINGVY